MSTDVKVLHFYSVKTSRETLDPHKTDTSTWQTFHCSTLIPTYLPPAGNPFPVRTPYVIPLHPQPHISLQAPPRGAKYHGQLISRFRNEIQIIVGTAKRAVPAPFCWACILGQAKKILETTYSSGERR